MVQPEIILTDYSIVGSDQAANGTAITGSPKKNNFLVKMAGFFSGLGAQTANGDSSGEIADEDNNLEGPMDEEGVAESTSTYHTNNLPARRDIYQIPSSPDRNDQEEENRPNNPRKRVKTAVKAKKSILPPKRSLRNHTEVPTKQLRAAQTQRVAPSPKRQPAREAKTVRNVETAQMEEGIRKTRSKNYPGVSTSTGLAASKIAANNGMPRSPAKRPRGRPRNDRLASPTSTATKKATMQVVIPSNSPVPELHAAPNEDAVGGEEDEEDTEAYEQVGQNGYGGHEGLGDNGVADILMNPSPVKLVPGKEIRQIKEAAPKILGKGAGLSDEEEESEILEDDHPQSKATGEEEPEGDSEGLMIKEGLLDKLIATAARVGHHYDEESTSWTHVSSPKVCSVNGKRTMRRVTAILEAYDNLRASIAAGDVEASNQAKDDISSFVVQLQSESRSILTNRLGNPVLGIDFSDKDKTRTMLQDLYFHIIPSLLKVLKMANEVFLPEKSMEQEPLRNIFIIIKMLDDLATTALKQPKEYQPRSNSKSDTWHISKPTSLLKSDIRKMRKTISKELASRELQQKALQTQRLQLKWARAAEKEQQRNDAEIRRRRKENRRARRVAYQKLCSEPTLRRLLRQENMARRGETMPEDRDFVGHTQINGGTQSIDYDQELEDGDDPFSLEEEDENAPRLSIFPTNNTNDSTHSKPLSEKEKDIFVECMMFERGMLISLQ